MEFQDILSNLQDWELSLKEKQHFESREADYSSEEKGIRSGDRISATKAPSGNISKGHDQHSEYSGRFKDINLLTGNFSDEGSPSAASEKDLGNECFKQKKFKEAIDCYSRSIALAPTAVAYANRAMAYLKIKRFKEAESDCTEALGLDDCYIKAYSRRATARKELGKLDTSIEDAEFALRLEPQNQELKKQYADLKQELLKKASKVMKNPNQADRGGNRENRIKEVQITGRSRAEGSNESHEGATSHYGANSKDSNGLHDAANLSSTAAGPKTVHEVNKPELRLTVQELASRAASRAMAEAGKDITAPKSAYQFEISWKRLAGDRSLQARLLKTVSPMSLRQLFKSSLSAALLIDMIKCISMFFEEETELAVNFLENLTKVSRFDMIIMCLSTEDKNDLQKIWDEVFLKAAIPIEFTETLSKLNPKYCL